MKLQFSELLARLVYTLPHANSLKASRLITRIICWYCPLRYQSRVTRKMWQKLESRNCQRARAAPAGVPGTSPRGHWQTRRVCSVHCVRGSKAHAAARARSTAHLASQLSTRAPSPRGSWVRTAPRKAGRGGGARLSTRPSSLLERSRMGHPTVSSPPGSGAFSHGMPHARPPYVRGYRQDSSTIGS